MADVRAFKTRDQLDKDELKAFVSQLIDEGSYIILVAHRNTENITDMATNLSFHADRIGVKGLLQEAQEIAFRIAPPVCFEGDVEI